MSKFIIKLDDSYLVILDGCELMWHRRREQASKFFNVTKEEVIKACEVLFSVKVEVEDA